MDKFLLIEGFKEDIYEAKGFLAEVAAEEEEIEQYKPIYIKIMRSYQEGLLTVEEKDEILDVFDEVGAPDLSAFVDDDLEEIIE